MCVVGSNFPLPGSDTPRIRMAHGGGGRMMQDLIREIILPAFRNPLLEQHHDGAIFAGASGDIAFTTDGYVVQPLFFPGGNIGTLAINGAVNDLAMCGAAPEQLAVSFVIEEGLPIPDFRAVVAAMAEAANAVGASIVTGDTKVVERGNGDGLFVHVSAIGRVRTPDRPLPEAVRPGDAILLSGDIARHGIAIMAARAGLVCNPPLESDTTPVWPAIAALIEQGIDLHCLRDLTRGGLTAGLVEVAEAVHLALEVEEHAISVSEPVRKACELFGLEPFNVANEGRYIAFLPPGQTEQALAVMRRFGDACAIGRVGEEQSGAVVLQTSQGTSRRLRLPNGEQMPRIC